MNLLKQILVVFFAFALAGAVYGQQPKSPYCNDCPVLKRGDSVPAVAAQPTVTTTLPVPGVYLSLENFENRNRIPMPTAEIRSTQEGMFKAAGLEVTPNKSQASQIYKLRYDKIYEVSGWNQKPKQTLGGAIKDQALARGPGIGLRILGSFLYKIPGAVGSQAAYETYNAAYQVDYSQYQRLEQKLAGEYWHVKRLRMSLTRYNVTLLGQEQIGDSEEITVDYLLVFPHNDPEGNGPNAVLLSGFFSGGDIARVPLGATWEEQLVVRTIQGEKN